MAIAIYFIGSVSPKAKLIKIFITYISLNLTVNLKTPIKIYNIVLWSTSKTLKIFVTLKRAYLGTKAPRHVFFYPVYSNPLVVKQRTVFTKITSHVWKILVFHKRLAVFTWIIGTNNIDKMVSGEADNRDKIRGGDRPPKLAMFL